MVFARRSSISLILVVAALLATAGIFAFARPMYQPLREQDDRLLGAGLDQPKVVREAFAAQGIRLRVSSRFNGIVTLSNRPSGPPLPADALRVVVAPRSGKGSWGPKLEPYHERFGNILVTYGGSDKHLSGRVEAAVAALR